MNARLWSIALLFYAVSPAIADDVRPPEGTIDVRMSKDRVGLGIENEHGDLVLEPLPQQLICVTGAVVKIHEGPRQPLSVLAENSYALVKLRKPTMIANRQVHSIRIFYDLNGSPYVFSTDWDASILFGDNGDFVGVRYPVRRRLAD